MVKQHQRLLFQSTDGANVPRTFFNLGGGEVLLLKV